MKKIFSLFVLMVLAVAAAFAQDGQPCSGNETLTDIDGNTYNTVQIGQQCWMKENLRTKHYDGGLAIPARSNSTDGYSSPNGNANHVPTYGYLYGWRVVMYCSTSTSANPMQGICPSGWHVPSDAEWSQLTNYVKSHSQYVCENNNAYIAKALAATRGWSNGTNICAVGDDRDANNATGFSAIPAGRYGGDNYFGDCAYFWSATESSSTGAYGRSLNSDEATVSRINVYKDYGYSVRCLRGEGLPIVTTALVTDITPMSATCGGNVGGANITARGVCWSTSPNPTVGNSHTTDGTGKGNFTSSITGLAPNTVYYVRAYATNSVGTSYGNEGVFVTDGLPCQGYETLTDIDGNVYNTVQIGQQCWMKENLRTMKYADGTSISQGSSTSTTTAYWYYPNNNSSNFSTYGLLYNWKAVMRNSSSSSANLSGVQGICPTGWHVPSDAEWTQLTDYVSSQSQYCCSSNSENIAMTLASTTGWNSSTTTCAVGNSQSINNTTGFGGVPAGCYDYYGSYSEFGSSATFWSATESSSNSYASCRRLYYDDATVRCTTGYAKSIGFSVRCLRGEGVPIVTTSSVTDITSTSATCGGNVGGANITTRGVCWSTLQNPTVSDSHTTDGAGTGSFTSSLTGLRAAATYYVRAYATNSVGTAYGEEVSFTVPNPNDGQPCPNTATFTDADGNVYNTVQIGQQCWMKENLRTMKYADGTSISQGSSTSTTTAYWYYPNNNSSNFSTYGLLYNWKAVMRNSSSSSANPSGVQGICPTGWHVPSDAEWTQLTDYVSSQSQYVCGSDNTYIAKALAGTTGWSSSTNTCAVGNMPSNNNATGFGALPAGYYYGYYGEFGSYVGFWSATELDGSYAYGRYLGCSRAGVSRYGSANTTGFSVRCLRD